MSSWTVFWAMIGALLGVNKGDARSTRLPPFKPTIVVTNLSDAQIGNAIYDIRAQRYIKISQYHWRREFNNTNVFVPTLESLSRSNTPPQFVLDNADAMH